MSTATLPGVAGTLGLINDPFRGHVLTVDGQRARRQKGYFLLPAEEGGEPVKAKLKGAWTTQYPLVVVGDRQFATGPAEPPFLLVISLLPLVLLFSGSWLGPVLAVALVGFNLWVLRTGRAEAWKTAVILTAFALVVLVVLIWAFFYSWILGLLPH